MGDQQHPECRRDSRPAGSRREFLRVSALAAAAAAAGATRLGRALGTSGAATSRGRGNPLPGRIVLYHDTAMNGHQTALDRDRVEQAVHHAVRILAEVPDTAAAFSALLPGLHSGSRIAIKPNCLSWNDSRWEVVRGIVSGLALTLDGTYDVSRVTIYDVQCNLFDHGYVYEQFTFNGRHPAIVNGNNCGSYYIYGGHRLSNYIVNADFVINVPVLKGHNVGYPTHEITTAFKNHYGSLCPQSLCNDIPGMLAVNADAYIRERTALVVTSAIRGVYQGGPWEPPQEWTTFPELTPNTIFATTDPVTEAYWARDFINAERAARGWSTFACPWIETASGDPYALGVSDPGEMTVIAYDPTAVPEDSGALRDGSFLASNTPNPFREGTRLRFRLARPQWVEFEIADAAGRVVRRLPGRDFAAGHAVVDWDGRNQAGHAVAPGAYFVRMRAASGSAGRRILKVG